jgi:hypothetical protein
MGSDSEKHWPPYPAGPKEVIFALGVISVNFTELEYVFSHVFSLVVGLRIAQKEAIFIS